MLQEVGQVYLLFTHYCLLASRPLETKPPCHGLETSPNGVVDPYRDLGATQKGNKEWLKGRERRREGVNRTVLPKTLLEVIDAGSRRCSNVFVTRPTGRHCSVL